MNRKEMDAFIEHFNLIGKSKAYFNEETKIVIDKERVSLFSGEKEIASVIGPELTGSIQRIIDIIIVNAVDNTLNKYNNIELS